jgi:glycosyltransferase involved in cell wall biosynthesis
MNVDVVHVLPHARSLGGSERTVLDLLESSQLQDVRQRVAFVRWTPVSCFPEPLELRPGRLVRRLGPLGVALTIARARPRVIHGWLLQGNLVGALARVLWPSSRLVTSERNVGHNLTPAKRVLERIVGVLESVGTANSGAVAQALIRRQPRRARRLRVILPGVAPLVPPAETVPCTAVMVGRLHLVKDHPTALRAWARVRQVDQSALLVIVGEGPRRAGLEAFADGLGLEGAVTWVGDTDPRPFLFGAQLFLSTSLAEGFSRALLEALCAGVPCVSTDVGGVSDLPPNAVRVVGRGDGSALASAICGALGDGQARAAARELAPAIRECFSRERCHAAYRQLYRELGVV